MELGRWHTRGKDGASMKWEGDNHLEVACPSKDEARHSMALSTQV